MRTRAAVKRRVTGLRQNVLHKSILAIVCSFLPLRSLVVATCISKQWQKDTVGCPHLWANLDFSPFSFLSAPPHRTVGGLVRRAGRSLQKLCVDITDWSAAKQNGLWTQIIAQGPLDFRLLVVSGTLTCTLLAEDNPVNLAQLTARTTLKRFSNGKIYDKGWNALPLRLTINGASTMEKPCTNGEDGMCRSSAYNDTIRKRCCAVCGLVKCCACSYGHPWYDSGWQFECLQCLSCFCIECAFPDFPSLQTGLRAFRPPHYCHTCEMELFPLNTA